jgi:hypothetical protein
VFVGDVGKDENQALYKAFGVRQVTVSSSAEDDIIGLNQLASPKPLGRLNIMSYHVCIELWRR